MGYEDGVEGALQAGPYVGSKVVNRADEVLVSHEDVRHEIAETDGANPSTEETLDCFLRGQLNELSSAKSHTANVGKDIIRYHQRSREEEPDHALEDIIHDKVSLNNYQV